MCTLDRLLISESCRKERMEAMAKVRMRDALDVWKFSCPTCFADPGEPCMTRTGTRCTAPAGTTARSEGISEHQRPRAIAGKSWCRSGNLTWHTWWCFGLPEGGGNFRGRSPCLNEKSSASIAPNMYLMDLGSGLTSRPLRCGLCIREPPVA